MLEAELDPRREYLTTASQAPTIMAGNDDRLLHLWQQRVGEIEQPDLSREWRVQLGKYLESFVLDWVEQRDGHKLSLRNHFLMHPTLDYVSATLDCYREFDDCVLDCKVCSSFYPTDDIIAFYTPQLEVQRVCKGATRAAIILVHGTNEPREYPIVTNEEYCKELWLRLAAFQLCCRTLTPPVTPQVKVVPPEQYRTVDLRTLEPRQWPNWAAAAVVHMQTWSDNKVAADLHSTATREIKGLLPEDVGRFFYSDVQVKRDLRGVSIKKVA